MTEEDRAAIRATVLSALCAPYPTIPRLADQTTARIVAIVDHVPPSPPLATDQEQPCQPEQGYAEVQPEHHPLPAHDASGPRRLAWPAGTRPRN